MAVALFKNIKKFHSYAWLTLGFCIAVILWGAYVRATGSGAGCGSHWPLCNGEVLPSQASNKTLIEFSQRISSGLSLLSVVWLFFWARKIFPAGNFVRKAVNISLVAMIAEAAIGAGLVLLKLVEHDESIQRVVSIALHLVNTMFLVAALTITAEASNIENPRWKIPHIPTRRIANLFLAGFLLLAALGAMTALGDTLFKPLSLTAGLKADWHQDSHITERLRIFHPLLAVAWVFLLVPWFLGLKERIPEISSRTWIALGIAALNLCLGTLNVILLAPVWLQMLHLLVANILWISFIRVLFFAASKWR